MSGSRASRVIDLGAAIDLVEDGMTVGISGFSYQNPPMAVVRALARKGVRRLRLVCGPTAGIETDLLIGSGCIAEVVAAGVAMERIAGIAPAFRHHVQCGDIRVWECDECIWYVALRAGAWRVPYLLWPGGVGTSLPELNADLTVVREGGRDFLRVPAIAPDVVFVHAPEADRYGNVRECPEAYLGRSFAERALAEACTGPVVATVESLIDSAVITASPEWTMLTGAYVAHTPWGAHPAGTSGRYRPDLAHLERYAAAGRALSTGDRRPFDDYMEEFVYRHENHDAYLAAVGGATLESLSVTSMAPR